MLVGIFDVEIMVIGLCYQLSNCDVDDNVYSGDDYNQFFVNGRGSDEVLNSFDFDEDGDYEQCDVIDCS